MVRKTFGIYSDDLSGSNLFIETGRDYIACWRKHAETFHVKAFELFSFREIEAQEFDKLYNEILLHSRLLTISAEKVYCIWGDEKCICIPVEFYDDDIAGSYMRLMFDEAGSSFYKDNLDGVTVLATLPNAAAVVSEYHNVAANVHKYFHLLKAQQPTTSENKLHIVFYHSHFIVSVFKEGTLQLIQNYSYRAPEDVLYHLLNICETFSLRANETPAYASGMIDLSSSLYDTVRAYIHHFAFEPVQTEMFDDIFQEYPLHYFASFCQYDV